MLLMRLLEDAKTSNWQLQTEIRLLTTPTPTSSVLTQTVSTTAANSATQTTPVTTSSAAQTDVVTINASSQTTTATKTNSTTQTDPATTIILPHKPTPAATLPSVTQPMSYAQATAIAGLPLITSKLGLSEALAKHQAAIKPAQSPLPVTAPPPHQSAFKGQQGTKSSELHLQLVSWTDFINKLQARYNGKISHCHALKSMLHPNTQSSFQVTMQTHV